MTNTIKLAKEKLDYLYEEKSKIESCGINLDPGHIEIYEFIVQEIAGLQLIIFEQQYQDVCARLEQIYSDCSTPSDSEVGDAV